VQAAANINSALAGRFAEIKDEKTGRAYITVAARRKGKWTLLGRGSPDGKTKVLAALKLGLARLAGVKGGAKLVMTSNPGFYAHIAGAKVENDRRNEVAVKQSQLFVAVPLMFNPRLLTVDALRLATSISTADVTVVAMAQSNAH
jgi:hypothetical protein